MVELRLGVAENYVLAGQEFHNVSEIIQEGFQFIHSGPDRPTNRMKRMNNGHHIWFLEFKWTEMVFFIV